MLVSIYRYNPETDDKPRMQDFEVEIPEGKDLMVLDVLALVKEQDASNVYPETHLQDPNKCRLLHWRQQTCTVTVMSHELYEI